MQQIELGSWRSTVRTTNAGPSQTDTDRRSDRTRRLDTDPIARCRRAGDPPQSIEGLLLVDAGTQLRIGQSDLGLPVPGHGLRTVTPKFQRLARMIQTLEQGTRERQRVERLA